MVKPLVVSRVINAPATTVFDVFTELDRLADRIEAITAVEKLTVGPPQQGTRFRQTRVVFGREFTEEMTITHFQRPERVMLESEAHGCRYISTFSFHTKPDSQRTEAKIEFLTKPLNLIARCMGIVLGPLNAKSMRKALESDLDQFSRAAETIANAGDEPAPVASPS